MSSYAAGVASVGAAIGLVRRAFQLYQEEVQRGRDQTIGQREVRTSLLQVSDESNFSDRLDRVDQSAINNGVSREKAAQALFDSISNEVESDFERILRADRVIPADIGAKFVGEFRKVFAKENLTADQSLNLGLAAAGTSKFNVQEIQPQIRTAAQGSALLPGVEASDVAAFVSVLGSQFGERSGTFVRSLQANAGAELINRQNELEETKDPIRRAELQEDIKLLSGSLTDIISNLTKDKDLRESITGGNKEVLTAFTVASQQLQNIIRVDKKIEEETAKAGTEDSLISKRLRAFFNDPKLAADFTAKQSEVRRDVAAEDQFSATQATVETRVNNANAAVTQDGSLAERAVIGAFTSIDKLASSTIFAGSPGQQKDLDRSLNRNSPNAQPQQRAGEESKKQTDALNKQLESQKRTEKHLEKMARNQTVAVGVD